MRHPKAIAGGAAVLVLGGGGLTAAAALSGGGASARTTKSAPTATDAVRRGDMTDTATESGTLAPSDPRAVPGGTSGTLTWTRAPGTRVRRDQPLFKIANHPVRLLYGAVPLYRDLRDGRKGPDVRQLQENLIALGYHGLSTDGRFGAGTRHAVERWQHRHHLKETGAVGPDEIAFLPGAATVTKADMAVGDKVSAGRTVLTASGSQAVANVPLDPSEQQVTHVGQTVRVRLPDERTVKGRVGQVGGPVPDGGNDDKEKINVQVLLAGAGRPAGTPVDVEFPGTTHKDVLSVPIGALLALDGGRYGVRLTDGRTIPVTLGLFTDGRVEVSGTGLADGVRVLVAGT